jgi:hypothetical protein
MGKAIDTLEQAIQLIRSGKPGYVSVTDDEGKERMQVVIPLAKEFSDRNFKRINRRKGIR